MAVPAEIVEAQSRQLRDVGFEVPDSERVVKTLAEIGNAEASEDEILYYLNTVDSCKDAARVDALAKAHASIIGARRLPSKGLLHIVYNHRSLDAPPKLIPLPNEAAEHIQSEMISLYERLNSLGESTADSEKVLIIQLGNTMVWPDVENEKVFKRYFKTLNRVFNKESLEELGERADSDKTGSPPEIPEWPAVATKEDFKQFHDRVTGLFERFNRFFLWYLTIMLIVVFFLVVVL